MQNPSTSPTLPLSTIQRLLIAFLLGAPVGFMATFTEQSINAPGIYGLWEVPVGILILAALLSIILDSNVRQGIVSSGRAIVGAIVVLVLSAIIIAGEVWLLSILQNPNANPNLNYINPVLIPLLISLAIAFTVGSSNGWQLALGVGLVAWFAAGLHFVIIALIDYIVYEQHTPGGDGGLALPLAIVLVLLGFLLAAIGSLIGRLLRKAVLEE